MSNGKKQQKHSRIVKEPEPQEEPAFSLDNEEIAEFRKAFLEERGRPLMLNDAQLTKVVEENDPDGNAEFTAAQWAEFFSAAEPTKEIDQVAASAIQLRAVKVASILDKSEELQSTVWDGVLIEERREMRPLSVMFLIFEQLLREHGTEAKAREAMNEMPVPYSTTENSQNPDKYRTKVQGKDVDSSFYEDLAFTTRRGREIAERYQELKEKEKSMQPVDREEIAGDIRLWERRKARLLTVYRNAMQLHFKIGEINSLEKCEVRVMKSKTPKATVNGVKLFEPRNTPRPIVIQNPLPDRDLNDFWEFTVNQVMRMNMENVRKHGGDVDACKNWGNKRETQAPETKKEEGWTVDRIKSTFEELEAKFEEEDEFWDAAKRAIRPGAEDRDELLVSVYRMKQRLVAMIGNQEQRAAKLSAAMDDAAGNNDKKPEADAA